MTLVLALVLAWCVISAVLALGVGPFLRRAALLAERREPAATVRARRAA